jgi:hypothetical protein
MAVKHKFVSGKVDGGDSTLVRPSNWNDTHAVEDGTVSAPTIAPDSDPNTGFYFTGADGIRVAIGGADYGGWNTSRAQLEIGSQIGFAPTNQTILTSTDTLNGYA